jgi:hypothetical protein
MQKYGRIQDGELIVNNQRLDGYKLVEFAPIPSTFDQQTQYVIQTNPVDNGEVISVGVEVRELPPQDEQSNVL